MCTWEGAPAWEHARRWRVGNPAGSAGGRLRARDWRFCTPAFVPNGLYLRSGFIYGGLSGGRGFDLIIIIYTYVHYFWGEFAFGVYRDKRSGHL